MEDDGVHTRVSCVRRVSVVCTHRVVVVSPPLRGFITGVGVVLVMRAGFERERDFLSFVFFNFPRVPQFVKP